MIIIDFNGVALGNITSQKVEPNEDLIRHMILNSLRMYNSKYRAEYGEMVIALDGGSWRRKFFPEYKASRRTKKAEDNAKWDEIYRILNIIKAEIKEFLPYRMVDVKGVEADDIIATLCHQTQEFGKYEKVMIISADKDFVQLHKYGNVKQYSPMTKKFIKEPDPDSFIFEHILKGDRSDGVPNILSPNDAFVSGIRQKPVTAKFKAGCVANKSNLKAHLGVDLYANFLRNQMMISLDHIPQEYMDKIVEAYNAAEVPNKAGVLNYLISRKCKLLVESVQEFL